MTGELELCAAAFFRAVGKDVATTDEFVMGVSLGQKWMTPSEAKTLLKTMADSGTVEVKDGYVRPKGNVSSIDVPLAYRPPKDILKIAATAKKDAEVQQADVFPRLMDVAASAGIQRREFIQECNKIQKRLDIDIAVAALIVLRDGGAPIDPYVDEVYGWVSGVTRA